MFDTWILAVVGMFGFLIAVLAYILKTWREIARVEGKVESVREDLKYFRDECESLRIRLKALEIASKEKSTLSAGKCVDGDILGGRAKTGGDKE